MMNAYNKAKAVASGALGKVNNKVLAGSVAITTPFASNAALDTTVVDAIKTEVLGDISTAVGAGFAILSVSLASAVGMSLLGRFISKGANGG